MKTIRKLSSSRFRIFVAKMSQKKISQYMKKCIELEKIRRERDLSNHALSMVDFFKNDFGRNGVHWSVCCENPDQFMAIKNKVFSEDKK